MFDILPTEILAAIADIEPRACMKLWMFSPRFRRGFDPARYKSAFRITHWPNRPDQVKPAAAGFGCEEWRDACGRRHRINLPAVIRADGTKMWYFKGKLGRDWYDFDLAIEKSNGDRLWFDEGRLHRGDDEPAIERADGGRAWCFVGRFQRANILLPTVNLANGTKKWCNVYGKLHRGGDLPAVVWPSGVKEYWIDGCTTGVKSSQRRRAKIFTPARHDGQKSSRQPGTNSGAVTGGTGKS